MKWFKHDSDARNSLKLRKVRRKYGAEGYAIYWFCLEAIAYEVDKDNLTFELKEDVETIAFELSMQESRVEEIMLYFVNQGLFESSSGVISCLKLAERIDKSMTNSPKMRAWLDAKSVMTCVDDSMTNNDDVNTCAELDKKRIEKNRLDNIKDMCPQAVTPPQKFKDEIIPKPKKPQKRFIKPTPSDIASYCEERKNFVDAEKFFNHYESNGWRVGKNPMKDWKAAVRTWEKNSFQNNTGNSNAKNIGSNKTTGEFDFLDEDTGWMQEIYDKRGMQFEQNAGGGADVQREFESVARAKTGMEDLGNQKS